MTLLGALQLGRARRDHRVGGRVEVPDALDQPAPTLGDRRTRPTRTSSRAERWRPSPSVPSRSAAVPTAAARSPALAATVVSDGHSSEATDLVGVVQLLDRGGRAGVRPRRHVGNEREASDHGRGRGRVTKGLSGREGVRCVRRASEGRSASVAAAEIEGARAGPRSCVAGERAGEKERPTRDS